MRISNNNNNNNNNNSKENNYYNQSFDLLSDEGGRIVNRNKSGTVHVHVHVHNDNNDSSLLFEDEILNDDSFDEDPSLHTISMLHDNSINFSPRRNVHQSSLSHIYHNQFKHNERAQIGENIQQFNSNSRRNSFDGNYVQNHQAINNTVLKEKNQTINSNKVESNLENQFQNDIIKNQQETDNNVNLDDSINYLKNQNVDEEIILDNIDDNLTPRKERKEVYNDLKHDFITNSTGNHVGGIALGFRTPPMTPILRQEDSLYMCNDSLEMSGSPTPSHTPLQSLKPTPVSNKNSSNSVPISRNSTSNRKQGINNDRNNGKTRSRSNSESKSMPSEKYINVNNRREIQNISSDLRYNRNSNNNLYIDPNINSHENQINSNNIDKKKRDQYPSTSNAPYYTSVPSFPTVQTPHPYPLQSPHFNPYYDQFSRGGFKYRNSLNNIPQYNYNNYDFNHSSPYMNNPIIDPYRDQFRNEYFNRHHQYQRPDNFLRQSYYTPNTIHAPIFTPFHSNEEKSNYRSTRQSNHPQFPIYSSSHVLSSKLPIFIPQEMSFSPLRPPPPPIHVSNSTFYSSPISVKKDLSPLNSKYWRERLKRRQMTSILKSPLASKC